MCHRPSIAATMSGVAPVPELSFGSAPCCSKNSATLRESLQAAKCSRLPPVLSDLDRSEEHTSDLQSLMRISYAVFCLKTKNKNKPYRHNSSILHLYK